MDIPVKILRGGLPLKQAVLTVVATLVICSASKAQSQGLCSVDIVAGLLTTYGGDGGPATNAQLLAPAAVAVDRDGTLYIADSGNHRIRKVTSDGVITTIGGNSEPGSGGDGGPTLDTPLTVSRIALDGAGNLYFSGGNRIWKMAFDGMVTTVAGRGSSGFSGDGSDALSAELNSPAGLAFDMAGNLYVADGGNNRIRRITRDGRIDTVAGSGPVGNLQQNFGGDEGSATAALLNRPIDVAIDSGANLYIADSNNFRVRQVTSDGIIHTIVGSGSFGFVGDGRPALQAFLSSPNGLAFDHDDNLYISDSQNSRIRRVNRQGIINTVNTTLIRAPGGLALDGTGALYVSEIGNGRIWRISLDGQMSVVAGIGTAGFSGDGGPATLARMDSPGGLAARGGNLFIADSGNRRIRKVDSDGAISTMAGTGGLGIGGFGDGGPAASALLYDPAAVALDELSNLYIADRGDKRVRKVSPDGSISTVISDNPSSLPGQQNFFEAVIADGAGNLYVADSRGGFVLELQAQGPVRTVAGALLPKYRGPDAEGKPATEVGLIAPRALALDDVGNLYIMELTSIRRIAPDGTIYTVQPAVGTQGPPTGLAVDHDGTLYLATGLGKVYRVTSDGVASTLVDTFRDRGTGYGPPFSPGLLALDETGNLYISDSTHRVRRIESVRECEGKPLP